MNKYIIIVGVLGGFMIGVLYRDFVQRVIQNQVEQEKQMCWMPIK